MSKLLFALKFENLIHVGEVDADPTERSREVTFNA